MKKTFTLLLITFVSNIYIFGNAGTFEYFINTQRSGSSEKFHGDYSGGTSFNGSDLGTITDASQSLQSTSIGLKSFEDNGSVVTAATFYYEIYSGSPTGTFTAVAMANPGGKVGNDRTWSAPTVDFLDGITAAGNYTVEMYYEIETNQVNAVQFYYRSNSNNNYKATFNVTVALPVTLTYLSAFPNENSINLDWQTTSELNNSHFEIEQSTNSKTWKAIGKATGAGTTDEVQNYTYTDKTPNQGINYYRLKQVDYDGAFDYSSIVSVVLGKDESINIYPNPVADQAVFEFQTEQKKGTILSIYNINGQLVKQTTLNENSSKVEIILSDLVTGMYFLQTTTNKTQIVQRFIKQ